jgi:hypothetical protein
MEAAARPFPREETTPPVTKINFGRGVCAVKVLFSVPLRRREAYCGCVPAKYDLLCGAETELSTADNRLKVES